MRQGSVGKSYPHFETTILNPDQKYWLVSKDVDNVNDNDNDNDNVNLTYISLNVFTFSIPPVEWVKSAQEEGTFFLATFGTRRRPKKSSTLR